MIYTHGLDRHTNHIVIYNGNTPITVMCLYFWYTPNPVYGDEFDEAGWIIKVDTLLEKYAAKHNLPYNELSAKPIKVENMIL